MQNSNQNRTKELVDQYLEIQSQQNKLQEKLNDLKIVIAKFSKETNQKHLKAGDTILKVKQYIKTFFPKIDQKGRKEVEEIMRKSKQWKHAITFDIVKLGLAFDKKKLSESLREKLQPFTKQEPVIRISKSQIKYQKKDEKEN
jgi:hypothetical protein